MAWFDEYEAGLYTELAYLNLRPDDRNKLLNLSMPFYNVTDITSRDQIINPEQIMNAYSWGNSNAERRFYDSYLKQLQNIQAQQQASYDEWYASSEQQVLRDRSAGLNTDILGLSGSEAPNTHVPEGSALDHTESNSQIFSSVSSGISSCVSSLSSIANLATAFTNIPLTAQNVKNAKSLGNQIALQNEQFDLQNESLLGVMMARDIADLYGTAQQVHMKSDSTEPFNMEAWFGDDANFAPLAAVYGNNPRYDAQLNKQRNAVLEHMRTASASQKDLASNIYDTGIITSSPYFSSDQKITMLQLVPFTKACADADLAETKLRETLANIRSEYSSGLNIETAVDLANAKNEYDASYYEEANGRVVAAFEQFIRECSEPAYKLEKNINQGYLDMFNSDPSGLGAWKAAYLYGSKGGTSWKEAYYTRFDDTFKSIIDSEVAVAQASGNYANLQYLVDGLNSLLSLSTEKSRFNPLYRDSTIWNILKKYQLQLSETLELYK